MCGSEISLATSMIRILLVEDHILFRQGVASLLAKQADMRVVGGAGSVQEAVAEALRLQPDLVLMDFVLPDGTGVEATDAILEARPRTLIVFLTIHEEDERLIEAVRHGAKGYLHKNTPVTELVDYLRGLARGEPALPPPAVSRVLEAFVQTPVNGGAEPEIMSRLTTRQLEVLRELKKGATNKEIAQALFIREQTVKNHVSKILRALELRSRYEAASFARRHKL